MEGARAPAAIAAVTTCNAIEVAVSCCWHHGHYGCAHAAKAGAGWSEAVAGAGVGWSGAEGGWCGDIDMGERAGDDGIRRVLRRGPSALSGPAQRRVAEVLCGCGSGQVADAWGVPSPVPGVRVSVTRYGARRVGWGGAAARGVLDAGDAWT